jgi:hypothetical protein
MIRPLRFCLSVLFLLCLGAAAAAADTVSHSAGVPLQTTDWTVTLDIPKFDSTLGTLQSVSIEVRDSLVHKIEYENQSPNSPSTFSDSTYVTVDVMRPASASFVTAIAKIYRTASVGIYDGVLDYAGTSGVTYDGIVDYAISSSTMSAPADLALFTGTGTIGLPCQARAYFRFGYSGGNARSRLTTQAAARVLVTYTYQVAVVPSLSTSWGRIKSLYR